MKQQVTNHRLLNLLHIVLLFSGMGILLAILGLSLAGVSGLLWALAFSVPLFLLGPRISPRLVLKMLGARPLSVDAVPGLYQTVRALARQVHLPAVPQLYHIPSPMMNAFTVGSKDNAALGMTDGLLRRLTARELTGVLAHEIAHIRNNDSRVMAVADLVARVTRLFAGLGRFLLLLNLPLLLLGASTVSWTVVALLLVAPVLSGLLQRSLSRSRELDADISAAHLTGDPVGLANALSKIECYTASARSAVSLPGYRTPDPTLYRTHPETSARVKQLVALAGPDRSAPAADELFSCTGHLAQVT